MYTIGTAGHVDHGKSALVQALSGIDPDRLQEEKRRGLTIDLGFAWLRLPSGREVSIVDVPGHERFIKNMLAGVGGIDLALLVIAADESVMPQTREHLAIIDLLSINRGVIAITKSDLVDEEWLALVQGEVSKAVEGTTLAPAPRVSCSAVTRQGLDALLAAIDTALDGVPPREDSGQPRLPIDRVFTMSGFGTVVTGTLLDGCLSVGQEVDIAPAGLRSRVRGLQNHNQKVETALPGGRTAVNLTGLGVEELERGMVLTTPGWLPAVTSIDVRLRTVPYLPRALRHGMEVSLHSGAAESSARLLLLDTDSLGPSATGWAQLRLARPLALAKGDLFVIRDPNDTLGGGQVVETNPRRHRRHHGPTMEKLAALLEGSPEALVRLALSRGFPLEVRQVAQQASLPLKLAQEALRELVSSGEAVALDPDNLEPECFVVDTSGETRFRATALEAISSYHQNRPLRPEMPREELRQRLGLYPLAFEAVVGYWNREDILQGTAGGVRLVGHRPSLPPSLQQETSAFLETLRKTPYAPDLDGLPGPELLAFLEEQGEIVRVSESVVFAADAYQEMKERITAHLRQEGNITLAQVRDMFGSSRKYAQALLEHLDSERITRRVGDTRVLR